MICEKLHYMSRTQNELKTTSSRNYFVFLFLLIPLYASAQSDSLSIGQRISDYPATTDYLIFKGRRYLADQLEKNHIDTVKMVMDYFDAKIDGYDYVSLLNTERVLLYYHTLQYDRLISFVSNLDSVKWRPKYYPPDKRVSETIKRQSILNFNILNKRISESDRSDEDKAFLKLLLVSLLPDGSVGISKAQHEKNARRFRELYPQSAYNRIIRKYVAAEYGLSDFGFSCGLGGGYSFFNNKNFDVNGCMIINMGFIYKKWQVDMGVQGSFGKLLQDVPVENWLKGKSITVTNIGISLGYLVFDSKRWRVTPFGGFAFNQITAGKTEENNKIIKGYSPLLGMDFDLKLNPWHSPKYNTSTVAYANLRINYLPATYNNNVGKIWSGNMLLFTLSVAFDFHFPERVF